MIQRARVASAMMLYLCMCVFCADMQVAIAANRVVIESATVAVGNQVTVGVYTENDNRLSGLVMPFEVRSVSNGAYPTAITASFVEESRMPTGINDPLSGLILIQFRAFEDGTHCKNGQPGGFLTEGPDNGSNNFLTVPPEAIADPDCIRISRNSVFPPTPLNPGTDFPIGTGVPSMTLTFTAPSTSGQFKIDTTCTDPGGHLGYGDYDTGALILPVFTLGMIDVVDCLCPHQGDLNADGVINSSDLNLLIKVAFFNDPDPKDAGCPNARTDINADGFVDSTDINFLIRYLFFNGGICDPCNRVDPVCAP